MSQHYNEKDLNTIMTKLGASFIALRDGSNSIADFNRLAAAMNIGMVRSEAISQQAVEVFQAAQRALLAADAIYESLKAYIFSPADLVDIAKAIQGYGEILRISTEEQMEKAGNECERRLAVGNLARNGQTH